MPEQELTQKEIEAFEGLNESYIEMDRQLQEIAPTCHLTKMFFDECDVESWWECKHCGHTKAI